MAPVHPLIKNHPEAKLLDLLLHFLVENDPEESVLKTLEYDLPDMIREFRQRRMKMR